LPISRDFLYPHILGFKADEEFVGYVKGYQRIFYLTGTDHRGTPQSLARTYTLEAQGVVKSKPERIEGEGGINNIVPPPLLFCISQTPTPLL